MTEFQDIKYSIIISYRDRSKHLELLLPRLYDHFSHAKYEIIIAEQDDDDKFQKNSLYNLAALRANGELLIFHDVDYYPADGVSYDTDELTPLYPVRNVAFLNESNSFRSINDIPAGYRNFINDVGDHSGGVFVLHRNLFFKINGFNPLYKGWGKEDDDTRDRLRLLGYTLKRNDRGLFYGLYHLDNKPADDDSDFIKNHILLSNLNNTLHIGYNNVTADVTEYVGNGIRWLKIKNFKYEN